MKGFDILKIKSAVKNHNKFDLSRTHLTTLNFGEIMPLMVEETVPGDKLSVNADYFSRLAPLAVPTYGKFQFKTVSAFVPYHQIAWDAEAWLAGKSTWEGQTPHHRYITADSLATFVNSYCTTAGNATNAQYVFINSSGTVNYKIFTNVGRYWVKVLNSLGYAIPQGVDLQTSSDWNTSLKNVKFSAYPLLAFFKLYNDYMSQSQRFNTSGLSNMLQCIKYGKTVSGYSPATGEIGYSAMKTMFDGLFLNYENDYFTSAWQSPQNPLNSVDTISIANVPGQSDPNIQATTGTWNTDVLQKVSTGYATISQRALDFLKDFDDWVRRNNYSGSRAVQQIYSRFGIKTDDYKSHYANVLSTDALPVQVGDVTSTSDTTGAILGDYAGKGIMSGSKGISCNVSDYGLFIILGYFTVTPMNAFGSDRRVLRNSPLDYYNPEFDGLGADPISVGELWSSPIVSGDTVKDTDVFGFTERYNAYRYGRDVITGEFRDYRATGDMNAWHTGRNLAALRTAGTLVAQSTAMNTLPQANSEYNRIFSNTTGDVDHFYLTCKFDVSAIRPMLNLNQVPRLGEGDTVVPRNGNTIS